ncbi:MAG: DUF91 domain-containing protein [Bacteroidales bacterium]|nr:DUF91 domain-containing protein [Bacteroidales bacterium]
MYKVDIENKKLIKLEPTKYSSLNLLERFDIQEWIEKTPEILGESLLVISKELELPSRKRLDLLAIDKDASLVVIELKRDDSGSDVEWQAIKYVSYCSNFLLEDIFQYYANYLESDDDDAQLKIEEFIDEEIDKLNLKQRIILCSKEFHSDVISAVLWLRDYGIDITCVKLIPYLDSNHQLFIKPEIIIPLPEAKDYIVKKESKQKGFTRSPRSSFSLEKSDLPNEELKKRLITTLRRVSDLTPRFIAFLEILISEDRTFQREEIKEQLYNKGIGKDVGQAGRYLSNISQFLTKKANPHLRQLISFDNSSGQYVGGPDGKYIGETKNNYYINSEYRELIKSAFSTISNIETEGS